MGGKLSISEIKESMPLFRDTLSSYGIKMNRHDFFSCPFHSDKTPSAHLRKREDGRVIAKCFSCGFNGSILDFVMEMEGCSFSAALEKLGGKRGGDPGVSSGKMLERHRIEAARNKIDQELEKIHDEMDGLYKKRSKLKKTLSEADPFSWAAVYAINTLQIIENRLDCLLDRRFKLEEERR